MFLLAKSGMCCSSWIPLSYSPRNWQKRAGKIGQNTFAATVPVVEGS